MSPRGDALRIVTIAPVRFPIAHPFAGGLESAVWNEVRLLRERGHRVELIATEGSDFLDGPDEFVIPAVDWRGDPVAADDTYPPGYLDRAIPALDRALDAVRRRADDIDVVVNHCLVGRPLERAGDLGVPMVSTLHTPVVGDLVDAHLRARGRRSRFLSVSTHTSLTWGRSGIPSDVLGNGVDAGVWQQGPGGDGLAWFGRIVREKGPHLALDVARRAGLPLVVAGRVGDRDYFERMVRPRLDATRRYVGPLDTAQLVDLVGSSGCVLTTPQWEEPFGLVTPESLLCGTPVAGFAAGGATEIAGRGFGVSLVPAGDVDGLAREARRLVERSQSDPGFRDRVRDTAVSRFSLDTRIVALEGILRNAADETESAA